jgi:hypothetical protein
VKQVAAHRAYQRNIPGHLLDPSHRFHDPIEEVNRIPRNPAPKIYVISDPEDQSVPFPTQLAYVRRLRAIGLKPQHVFASAPRPAHHVLSGHARRAATLIARGETSRHIRAALHELDSIQDDVVPKERPDRT